MRDQTEITIKGKLWRVERLEGTVVAASKSHDVEIRGSSDNKINETVVRDRIFLRDAQGTEHVLRLWAADVDCREGHHLVALWLMPVKPTIKAAAQPGEGLEGDTFNLALIFNRDTGESNWRGGTGVSTAYPLTYFPFLVLGCLGTCTLVFFMTGLIAKIPGRAKSWIAVLGALLAFAAYAAMSGKHYIGARGLRKDLLALAKEPVQATGP